VHINSNGAYQTFLQLSGAPVFPMSMTGGPVYLRLYLMLAAPMSSGHNTYFKAGPADPTMTNLETRVGVMNSMLMINQPPSDRGVLSNANYYTDNKPGIVFTPMTWNCVEVMFDPAKSSLDVWVAGKEVPDLHVTDWEQSAIGAFRFGFEQYAGPSAEFWYDDIAVGTKQIGCD